jgi:hypothetical protein
LGVVSVLASYSPNLLPLDQSTFVELSTHSQQHFLR